MDISGQIKSIFLKLNVLIFIIVTAFFTSVASFGQDIHFSQFPNAPLFHNPATTGVMDSDVRLTNIFRSQWRTLDSPYNTLQISADAKSLFLTRLVGFGGLIVHDNSLGNYLTTDQIYLSFSHSFFYKNHQISIGLQPGLILKKFNNSALRFGNQFNTGSGSFDPDLPSNEDQLNERLNYFNLNAGLFWRTRIKNFTPSFGFAVQNIMRPRESFLTDKTAQDRLPLKYTMHGQIEIPLVKAYSIDPMFLLSTVGSSRNLIVGTNSSYYLSNKNMVIQKIYVLAAVRINPFRNFDALILGTGTRILNFDICLSYDLNISSLREVSNFRGAYEISLIYRVNHNKKNKHTEPCIIF